MQRNGLNASAVVLAMLATVFAGKTVDGADAQTSPADDVERVAQAIDAHLQRRWQDESVTPSHVADDAEFLRRAYLDIAGKIPPVAEVRAFLANPSPNKRQQLVDDLLASSSYVMHFTAMWRSVLLPEADSDLQVRVLVPGFESWLRQRLADNAPYDEMAREILTLPFDGGDASSPEAAYQRLGGATPLAFYQAKQIRPENLAAATSRTFLGLRMECAQCHDHPFADWRQEQFWSFAAFFAGIVREGQDGVFGRVREIADRRELAIPDAEKVVQAAFLDGATPRFKFRVSARETLADWMLADANPYFARAAVNRMWAHFFGIGLVDPVDDMGVENPASDPELLDELARAFVEHDYDLKFLIRAITSSQAYQLSSERSHPSQEDARRFARMPVRGLTAEQLYASLQQATGRHEAYSPNMAFVIAGDSPKTRFLQRFANASEPPTGRSITILQALAMMNGAETASAADLNESRTLTAVTSFPGLSREQQLETLYLAALGRPPRDEELARLLTYVGEEDSPQTKQKFADVFWALLNSSEFLVNH